MAKLIDQFPKEKLSPQEEARLAKSDPTSLVMHSMREALLYTQRVCRDRIPEDARVSICYKKLSACVNRFRPGRIRFLAFAKAGLRGAMKDYWISQTTVRNATEIISTDYLDGCRFETPFRIPEYLRRAIPTPSRGDDEAPPPQRETLTNEIEHPDFDKICARDRWAEIKKRVDPHLNSRQRMILSLVYDSGLNYQEIGTLLGFTRSLVHAVHRDTIRQIQDILAKDGRLLKE